MSCYGWRSRRKNHGACSGHYEGYRGMAEVVEGHDQDGIFSCGAVGRVLIKQHRLCYLQCPVLV